MASAAFKRRLLLLSLLMCVQVEPWAKGQEPINAADSGRVRQLLDREHSTAPLDCSIQPQTPRFDFAFQFDVGFIITCPRSKLGGDPRELLIVARVTPDGAKPRLFGDAYRLPEITRATKPRDLNQNVEISEGFAVGEGQYQIEVLVADRETDRTSRKRWRARVARHGSEMAAPVAAAPGSVIPLPDRPWPIKLDTSGKGLRITVLLDAAPLNPRSPALRAWDWAFLLGSLSSMLRQIPCVSVRLRAFNLAQQREVFRQDRFDDAGFVQLNQSLHTLELGTISSQVLQQRGGGIEMLLDYANRELTSADPSDAVIFLGPRGYFAGIPHGIFRGREPPNPHFYYFEYLPSHLRDGQLPDAISNLIKRLDGTVYLIFSPGDLARSIQKMSAQLEPRRDALDDGRWSPRPAPAN